jgi:hyperosmotically inducible periplasmic protein
MNTTPKHSKAIIAAAVLTVLFAGGDVANTGTTPPASESSGSTTGTTGAGTTGTGTATTTPSEPASPSVPASGDTSANPKSAGAVVDDTVITTKVKTALLADSDIKGLQINVDTSNGVVTLSGAVDNQTQIDRAGKLAADVQGVASVTNNLTIKK